MTTFWNAPRLVLNRKHWKVSLIFANGVQLTDNFNIRNIMPEENNKNVKKQENKPNMIALLKPYSGLVIMLIVLALFSNGINLIIPKIIANGIDSYSSGHLIFKT
ncbi:MAG: hypothetical protein EPN39_03760, partial [Chitinophagaceae bacterium]